MKLNLIALFTVFCIVFSFASCSKDLNITSNNEYTSTSFQDTSTTTSEAPTTEAPVSYVLNKSSRIFHFEKCPSVTMMKEDNKILRKENRDKIIKDGYEPCGRCNP